MIRNTGKIGGTNYIKYVVFNKAVLWKDKQLSIPTDIFSNLLSRGVLKLKYIDRTKNEEWDFAIQDVIDHKELKRVGQETQFYFPIEFRKVIKLK